MVTAENPAMQIVTWFFIGWDSFKQGHYQQRHHRCSSQESPPPTEGFIQAAFSPNWVGNNLPPIADGVMLAIFVWQKVLLSLFRTVFRDFAKRIATASITFKKQGQETKHHYASQRQLTGKGKPFKPCMWLLHESRLDSVLENASLVV